jgi:YaiO family outer membrane protein
MQNRILPHFYFSTGHLAIVIGGLFCTPIVARAAIDITTNGSFGPVQNTLPFQEQSLLVEPSVDESETGELLVSHVARFGISNFQGGLGYRWKDPVSWSYGLRTTFAPGAVLLPKGSLEVHANRTVALQEEFYTSVRYSSFWNAQLWSTSFRMETYQIQRWLLSADLRPSLLTFSQQNTEILFGFIGRATYFISDDTRLNAWVAPGQEGTIAPNGEQTLMLQTRAVGASVRVPIQSETNIEVGYEYQQRYPSQFRSVSTVFATLRVRID